MTTAVIAQLRQLTEAQYNALLEHGDDVLAGLNEQTVSWLKTQSVEGIRNAGTILKQLAPVVAKEVVNAIADAVPSAEEVQSELKQDVYKWKREEKVALAISIVVMTLAASALLIKNPTVSVFALPFLFLTISEVIYVLWDKYQIPYYSTYEEIRRGNIAVALAASFCAPLLLLFSCSDSKASPAMTRATKEYKQPQQQKLVQAKSPSHPTPPPSRPLPNITALRRMQQYRGKED